MTTLTVRLPVRLREKLARISGGKAAELSLWGPEVPEAAIRHAAALLQEQNTDQFDFYAELVRALDSLRRAQSN